MATATAESGFIRKNAALPKRWTGELRKKREAQAEPTFFSGPAVPGLRAGSAKGAREAAMLRGHPDRDSSEVARFRWESG